MTSTQHTGNGRTEPHAQVPSIPLSPDDQGAGGDASIGHLVGEATTHLSTLIRSEVELAKAEVAGELRKAVRGSVYFIIALSVLIFSLFFLFFTIAEVLAIWLPRSAAFGIVFAMMLLAAAGFGLLGYRRMRGIRKPERTISTVRDTAAVARGFRRGHADGDGEVGAPDDRPDGMPDDRPAGFGSTGRPGSTG